MQNVLTWYKKANDKTSSAMVQANGPKKSFSLNPEEQLKIFLYELEKKLIRLEVSLRRLRHDPSGVEQFINLLRQVILEMDGTFTPEIRDSWQSCSRAPIKADDFQQIMADLKQLLNHLQTQLQEQRSSHQIMHKVQDDIKSLLDRQISRAVVSMR